MNELFAAVEMKMSETGIDGTLGNILAWPYQSKFVSSISFQRLFMFSYSFSGLALVISLVRVVMHWESARTKYTRMHFLYKFIVRFLIFLSPYCNSFDLNKVLDFGALLASRGQVSCSVGLLN